MSSPFDAVVTGTMTVVPSHARILTETSAVLSAAPLEVGAVDNQFDIELVTSDSPGLDFGPNHTYDVSFNVSVDGKRISVPPFTDLFLGTAIGNLDLDILVDDTPEEPGGGGETPPPEDSGEPSITLSVTITEADISVAGMAEVSWAISGASELATLTIGRDGTDSTGAGPWSTPVPLDTRAHTFDKLLPGNTYTFTVTATSGTLTASDTESVTIAPDIEIDTQEIANYTPGAPAWEWRDQSFPDPVGNLDASIELVVTGLSDTNKNAAALFRGGLVRVVVSSDAWFVEAAGYTTVRVPFAHLSGGVFRAVADGTTLSAFWDGVAVGSVTVGLLGTSTVDNVGIGVWENSAGAVSITLATVWEGDTEPGPGGGGGVDPPPVGTGTWYSGASSPYAANGSFGQWRGEPITVGGTWCNGNTYMLTLDTIQPGKEWGSWSGKLDLAVGGIDYTLGETWAAAASGSYDGRWTQSAKNIAAVWTARGKPAGNLYVRFAHEMNGDWFPWRVPEGQEANFISAARRWSNIMRLWAPGVKLVISFNKNRSPGMARSINLWPGSSYFDVYSVDSYNVWPWKNTASEIQSEWFDKMDGTDPVGVEKHRARAQTLGVPFALSEWSNGSPKFANEGGGGGESTLFIDMVYDWMLSHAGTGAGQFLYDVLFNLWERYALYGSEATQPITAARYASKKWGGA